MRYIYPCNIELDEEEMAESGREAYSVTFPDLPGAITFGWTWEEAREMAEDVLDLVIGVCADDGGDIPQPSEPKPGQVLVPVPIVTATKLVLNEAMREKGITQPELAKLLNISEEEARKTCETRYRTHITRMEKALRAIGRRVVLEGINLEIQ